MPTEEQMTASLLEAKDVTIAELRKELAKHHFAQFCEGYRTAWARVSMVAATLGVIGLAIGLLLGVVVA
jgi:hypothetical protein